MTWLERVRRWARGIKRDVVVLWLAARDRRVPWYAKLAAGAVAAYALSPIDLIPDFIPVLGYLDDLIIVPVGIIVVLKLIPVDVLADLRAAAMKHTGQPVSRAGLVAVVSIWVLLAVLLFWVALDPPAAVR
ncbi:YkvA family protein [Sinorhizobium meliloti]|uniref:YkvA family protein n=1 Tax=Rhizobium meliloti TaxID=382 RepID=UPI00398CE399